ncbi:MAG: hypothetical protein A2Y79_05930 [Deltaproteobacteria bacterium RBG_13_43_22]|nr:MAG: hypothetical protein A2Y79_05930 [Deltaproteobacteria bacterium RBG_13_43_22]
MDVLPWHKMRSLALSGGGILFFGEAMARLSAYLMGQLSLQGKSITLVDATQSFDPYLVARVGRLSGTSPRILLERIRLSRAFTCHQLVTLLCETLPGQRAEGPLFILGPGILFYDEQVSLKERQALFHQVVRSLIALKEKGQGYYLFQGPISRQVKNRHFGRELSNSVQWVVRVALGKDGLEGKLLKAGFDGERIQGNRV